MRILTLYFNCVTELREYQKLKNINDETLISRNDVVLIVDDRQPRILHGELYELLNLSKDEIMWYAEIIWYAELK